MLHRVRSRMRFPRNAGMAVWARDNMAVRHGMAVHIRQGEPAAEAPVNRVDRAGNRDIFVCDLPLMDQAHAQDAVETLAAIFAWSEPEPDGEGGTTPAYVEYHQCHHEDDPDVPRACVVIDRREAP